MNWNDVTIRQYQNLCREIEETYPDEVSRSIGLLSSLTGKLISHFEELPLPELKKQIKSIGFIQDKPEKVKVKSKLKVGKKVFQFQLDMNSISASQYIDLTELVKDNKKINDNLHLILAVMSIEVNWFGKDKKTEIKDRANYLLHNMTMLNVFALSGFFLNNYQRLTKAINVYLDLEMKKTRKQMSEVIDQALSVIGDGTTP